MGSSENTASSQYALSCNGNLGGYTEYPIMMDQLWI